MVFLCITIVFPFWQQIVISISPVDEASEVSLHLYTANPTLDAYKRLFKTGTIIDAYFWTILRTVLGTVLTVTVTTAMAYPLSKRNFTGRNFWMSLVAFTMFFGGGLIPTYLVVHRLKLLNTIWALVLPCLCSAWNIIIVRNYFQSLPEELEESAKIDSANDIQIFARLILPLSKPILATITLWTMVDHWNAWYDAMIYTSGNKIIVLQNFLRQMLDDASRMTGSDIDSLLNQMTAQGQNYNPESVRAAVLMLVTGPIICVYPFLQKYFVKGLMVGSIKG